MQNENIHKRGRYSAEFKEKVTLEALSGAKTHVQIAAEYGISPDLAEGLGEAMEMTAEWLKYYNKERPHWRWVTRGLRCTGSQPSPRWRRIFCAIFSLQRSLRRYH